jgi:protein SCO1/2
MISRRGLFTTAAALPLAHALVAHADTKKPHKAAPAEPRKFMPRRSGREMFRDRFLPNIELVTSEGQKVKFYDDLVKDKIVILNLMYAHCNGICPTTTTTLKKVRSLLHAQLTCEIFTYSLTLKPEEDSPASLKEYARMHGINDPHWLFLTGKPDDVDLLRHTIGFADPNPDIDRDKSRHSGMLRYGNEPMTIWGTCQGSAEPDWIAQEIGFAIPRAFKKNPRVNE